LQPRSALREVGKAYGLSESRIGAIVGDLPQFWRPGFRQRLHEAQARLIEQARAPIEREAIEMSQALTGTPHHLSIHPGGIVISPGPITDLVPLQHATKGLLITQFDLTGIEKLGLIKIDLLGISALTVVADSSELVRQRDPAFSIDHIPLDDPAAIHTLSSAHTIGCFQIESPGMRFTLRELAAGRIDDLIVALALYRPGPLKGGLKDAFVRRHLGQEPTSYLHPALEPILRETYGVILYQEQVLRIAHEVAGFTLGEADQLRRAMSKFRSAHEMELLRAQFIAGAWTTSRIAAPIAEQIWDLMAAFAGYGFPKAHAAGYATVAYRMAYLKAHYPAEFFAARLAVWGGYYAPRVYMSEARHVGLTVKPPHVNHSSEAFTLDPIDRQTLWMGLGQVRELTHTTIETILARRPFMSLDDFMIRACPLHVEAVNLIKCAALDGLGDQAAMLAAIEHAPWHGRHSPQLSMRLTATEACASAPSLDQRAAWEREILGYNVSLHPLALLAAQLDRAGVVPSPQIGECLDRSVALGGVRIAYHHVQSAGKETMLLVDMEDQYGLYQVLWGGAALRAARPLINHRQPVLVRGTVRRDRRSQIVVVGSSLTALDSSQTV
jgi:DNA-directed DNA polymerase III PolC